MVTLQRQLNYLSAFQGIALALMNRLDINEVYESLVQKAALLMDTPHAFIALLADDNDDELINRLGLGCFSQYVGMHMKISEGAAGKVVQTGLPVVVDDYSIWEGRSPRNTESSFRAIAVVPLHSSFRIIGTLGVAYSEPERVFSTADVELLRQFAQLASVALDSAALYSEARREIAERRQVEEKLLKNITEREEQQARLDRQSRLLRGVAETLHILLVNQDTQLSIGQALAVMGEAIQADRVYIYEKYQHPDNGKQVLQHRFGWDRRLSAIVSNKSELQQMGYDLDPSGWGDGLFEGKTIACVLSEAPVPIQNIMTARGILSILYVPIFTGKQLWGVVGFDDCQKERVWTGDEKTILQSAADTLGAILVRREMEMALRQSEAQNRALVQAIPDLIIHMNRDGLLLDIKFDPRGDWLMHSELPAGQSLYQTPLPLDIVDQYLKTIEFTLQSNMMQTMEYALPTSDGINIYEARVIKVKEDEVMVIVRNITANKQFEQQLIEAQEGLKRWVGTLEQRNREIELLSRLNSYLEICVKPEEAYTAISEFATLLFKGLSGCLFISNGNDQLLNPVSCWGEDTSAVVPFASDACWALRHGLPHFANMKTDRFSVQCDHFTSQNLSHLCLPISIQKQFREQMHYVGVMSLWNNDENATLSEAERQLATEFSERISLALSNLFLRDLLRQQAIRDPLTNLFNRRFMFESLDREIKRAEREKKPLSILMFDLDHFKQVNDTFGHAAGDEALRKVGELLNNSVRGSDIACRYGGEEFVLVLADVDMEIATQRAAQINQAVRELWVIFMDKVLPQMTVSVGVAVYPLHGSTSDAVLRAADTALYKAKVQGRNRVAQASIN